MSGYRPIYTHDEDLRILRLIIDTKSHYRIRGKSFWQDLSNSGHLDRSWQSLKERFERHILPRINDYDITSEEKMEIQLAHHQLLTNFKNENNFSAPSYSYDDSDEDGDGEETDESDEDGEGEDANKSD
ncbi:hypothetical protein NQ314_011131 [Rhamnusium bicolor]|uniref:TERF2-interacting telomeric protein 1 Myb domain-containing protein n=1 Tax=Rhamnusium bicolor TaxID=1586634 RepID=A0AAV8XL05_9CUCU|nr:hypothetical protein NQ314_011131 [Rhamnusium bicolor]